MNQLKRHRLAMGLTQAVLGKRIGVTQGAVQRWESGQSLPSPSSFPKLARALNVNPIELTRFVAPEQEAVMHAT